MNYLAHFHLAGDDKGLQLGALLGDYIKGPLDQSWPDDIERGIRLHRHIDRFSDSHPVQQELKAFLPTESHRYRGIIFDVFCDHYLSRSWDRFHHNKLNDFARQVYRQLETHRETFPEKARNQAWRLQYYDALCCFADLGSVMATLERISERLREKDKLLKGAEHFAQQVDAIEPLFMSFYPELVTFSNEMIMKLSDPNRIKT